MQSVIGLTGGLTQLGQWMDYPNEFSIPTGNTKDGYLGFDYPITITSYKMWSGMTSSPNATYSFKMYGANTFGSWTQLDTRTLVAIGSSSTFSIASPASYSYYRISITDTSAKYSYNSGTGFNMRIKDIQLQGYLT